MGYTVRQPDITVEASVASLDQLPLYGARGWVLVVDAAGVPVESSDTSPVAHLPPQPVTDTDTDTGDEVEVTEVAELEVEVDEVEDPPVAEKPKPAARKGAATPTPGTPSPDSPSSEED